MDGKIIAGVINRDLLNYYIKSDPRLKNADKVIQFNSKTLDTLNHYVCFKKSPEGLRMMQIFNEGLKKINAKEVIESYFKAL